MEKNNRTFDCLIYKFDSNEQNFRMKCDPNGLTIREGQDENMACWNTNKDFHLIKVKNP